MLRSSLVLLIVLLGAHFVADVVVGAESDPRTPPVLLQMIRDDAVHDQLQLTAEQRDQVVNALEEVDSRWFRSRNVVVEKQRLEIEQLTTMLRKSLDGILEQSQATRLSELERQALGTRMVLRADVVQALQLTEAQQRAFRDAFTETDQELNEIAQQSRKGEKDQTEAQKEVERLKAKERKSLASRLTSEQRSKLGSLTGSPFDFGRIKRTYPLAPELTEAGVTWIQGGPLTLKELRGKVVAVHYYAFQCINCQRNLPHYKAWHDDYAEQGLVIIGIQTPETHSERSLDRVAAAAKNEGIEYPLMLDAESSNWKSWHNTMWPTVYLIDKKGFLRRWWQGEMNWQGTPGERQMRETIETLLAEES